MNWKRFCLASLAAYIFVQAADLLVNSVFMKSDVESYKELWRPNMTSRLWVMYVIGVLVAVLFTYIFVKGREGKGVPEGIRYGLLIWLFVQVPMSASMWVLLPISYRVMLKGLIYGLFETIVAGILVAVIYKPLAPAKAPVQP
jgi:uncharacterized PurR-regulated membrane protein YhhQ (DUF165 family)